MSPTSPFVPPRSLHLWFSEKYLNCWVSHVKSVPSVRAAITLGISSMSCIQYAAHMTVLCSRQRDPLWGRAAVVRWPRAPKGWSSDGYKAEKLGLQRAKWESDLTLYWRWWWAQAQVVATKKKGSPNKCSSCFRVCYVKWKWNMYALLTTHMHK